MSDHEPDRDERSRVDHDRDLQLVADSNRWSGDAAAERVFERVRSGSWRASVDRAAERQRQRWVRSVAATLVALAIGGIWAVGGREGDDRATSGPHIDTTSSVASVPTPSTDPCKPSTGPVVTAPLTHPCGRLASDLNAQINGRCLTGIDASNEADDLLRVAGLLGNWAVVEDLSDEACALVWVDVAARRLVVSPSLSCPYVEPGSEAESDPADPYRCGEVGYALSTEVNGQCLTTAAAHDVITASIETLDVSGWTVVANDTDLCALAWVDGAALTVTIDDSAP